jgi:hypothetical protein
MEIAKVKLQKVPCSLRRDRTQESHSHWRDSTWLLLIEAPNRLMPDQLTLLRDAKGSVQDLLKSQLHIEINAISC